MLHLDDGLLTTDRNDWNSPPILLLFFLPIIPFSPILAAIDIGDVCSRMNQFLLLEYQFLLRHSSLLSNSFFATICATARLPARIIIQLLPQLPAKKTPDSLE
jgi:hypothetical protein